ncbi:MAG: type IV secretory system conjugative DNA transfer family protein [Bacteroidota bacterium]
MPILRFVRYFLEFLGEVIFTSTVEPLGFSASFSKETKVLKRKHTGFCLTGTRSLSRQDSYKNALVIGPSGSGKSSIIFIPTILKAKDASLVIHDPSGELYQKTSGYLARQGYHVQILNFADEAYSDGFNPLVRAQSSSEINKVASMIIRTVMNSAKSDPFWNLQAISLLSLMIGLIKTEETQYQTLRNVRELVHTLSSDAKVIENMIRATKQEDLIQEFVSFIAFDEKVKVGVIATVLSALQIFTDDTVAKVTSFDSINPELFRTQKTALFIQNSVTDGKYYTILSSLFFEQFFASLFTRLPHDGEHDILFLLDEAGVLHIPSLAQVISNVRKYRSGILLGMQDFQQLVEHYGQADAQTIKTNAYAKLYLSGQSHQSAEEISQVLGKTEVKRDDGQIFIRPLQTGDEVRMLPPKEAILIIGHFPPMKPRLLPYYLQSRLLNLTFFPQPPLRRKLPHPPLSLSSRINHES